jgi:hypothetical protein
MPKKDSSNMKLLACVFWILVLSTFILLGCAIYDAILGEHIQLKKTEWACTQTQLKITNVQINGVLIPQVNQQCIEYRRK